MLVTLGGQGLKTKFQTPPVWYNKTLRKKRMIAIYDLKYVKKSCSPTSVINIML